MTIDIHPKRVLIGLLTVFSVLLVLNLAGLAHCHLTGRELPVKIVHFDDEQNLPSLFSTANLALCGLFCAFIALAYRSSRREFLEWTGLVGIFFFLAIDEFIMVHERIAHIVRIYLKTPQLRDAGWVVPYVLLVVCFAGIYLRFFFRLPKPTKLYLVFGALLFVAGSIGVECIGCMWWRFSYGTDMVYFLLATIEESLEMLGVIAIIYALMRYIADYLPDLGIRLVNDVASKP